MSPVSPMCASFIDPEECIDCDARVEACPVDAIFAEDQLPEEWQHFTKINADYHANTSWPQPHRGACRGRRRGARRARRPGRRVMHVGGTAC
jgi:ferredoxin